MNKLKLQSFRLSSVVTISFIAVGVMLAATVEAGGVPPADSSSSGTAVAAGEAPFDLSDPARIASGKNEYNQTCATFCHGMNSELFVGRKGLEETYVYKTIRDGGAGGLSPMPAWGDVFSAEEIWELVAYLKSIGNW